MKVQVRFNQEELTAAITRHLEAEGYAVKAVRFSYDANHHPLDPIDGVSCEADVEPGPRYTHQAVSQSHIAGARTFTPETDDQQ